MKKISGLGGLWHIIIISVSVLVLSLLCWIEFAKSGYELLILRLGSKGAAVEKNIDMTGDTGYTIDVQTNTRQYREDTALSGLGALDRMIDTFDSMWCDAIYQKSFFSKIDTKLTYHVTGEFLSNQVIKGNGSWLFFKDATVIADYEGTNRYMQGEMLSILRTVSATQEELEKRGIRFAVLIAPNKENIYSEFMPAVYVHEKVSSTDILVDYLSSNGVNIVSPKNELLEKHLETQLYYSYDTHWNQLGAYIGVGCVLDFWDMAIPELSQRTILSRPLKEGYHYCGNDDLARVVGLLNVFEDEVEYEISGTASMDWDTFEREQTDGEVSYFKNESAKKQASVLLVGDSYRTSMVPALREAFSDVYVVHRSYYSAEVLDAINPDYLIAQYVERYSRDMGTMDSLLR